MNLDNQSTSIIFRRRGNVFFDFRGHSMALSPQGNLVAFTSQKPSWPTDYDELLLEVWDTIDRKKICEIEKVLDDGISFFPDGTQFVYCAAVLRSDLNLTRKDFMAFGSFKNTTHVPATFIFNPYTREKRLLHIGWHLVVSTDGKWMIVDDLQRRVMLVEISTGKSRRIKLPGYLGGLIGLINDRYVIYNGVPQKRAANPRIINCTVKITDLETGEYQTILDNVSRYELKNEGCVSFSPGRR